MESHTNRIPSLDGLRAISIALVVVSHLFWGAGIYFNKYLSGILGVRIFFVISGFLITSILLAEWEKTSTLNLGKFYFRRTLRIFPAYYFYIFVMLTATILGFYAAELAAFLPSMTYTSNYFHAPVWELGHTWSLAIEEQFYLLFPGIFLLLKLRDTKKFLFFIILISPVVRLATLFALPVDGGANQDNLLTLEHSFHTNMDVLAVGCLLALTRRRLHEARIYRRVLRSNAAPAIFLGGTMLVGFCSNFTVFFFGVGLTLMNIFIAALIDWLVVNHDSPAGRVLNSKPFVFVGTLSYSLYLWQQPFTGFSAGRVWTQMPFNIILITVFSLFSYYVIEKNFLRMRERAEKSIFPNTEQKTALSTNS